MELVFAPARYQRTVFKSSFVYKYSKRVRNLNMELPNQNMTIMVRPLPLFGSGAPHDSPRDPVAKGRVLVARTRPLELFHAQTAK